MVGCVWFTAICCVGVVVWFDISGWLFIVDLGFVTLVCVVCMIC